MEDLCFSIGNFIIATFGGLYASLLGHIAPANFSFAESLIFSQLLLLVEWEIF